MSAVIDDNGADFVYSTAATHFHDLPEPLILQIFALVTDVRSRNSLSLTCRRWRSDERATRSALALRGNPRHPALLPCCFPAVSHLDLSLISPWGHPFLAGRHPLDETLAARLAASFPAVDSLAVYARGAATIAALAVRWPRLRHARLVRWHQRPIDLVAGGDLSPLLAACPKLSELDLSEFYCWTDDVPAALTAHPAAAASLTSLDLGLANASDGFPSSQLAAIASSCHNLRRLIMPCVFNPQLNEFVDDAVLLALASSCPRLTVVQLTEPAVPVTMANQDDDVAITSDGLESFFAALPCLEDFGLDLWHRVQHSATALEALARKCPRLKALKLGHFQGVCKAAGLHLDGVAVCGAVESLCIKRCADLSDTSLARIGRGCRKLSKFEIQSCNLVTAGGIRKLATSLRWTLCNVSISGCHQLDATSCLAALDPIRDRLVQLHIDCVWSTPTTASADGGYRDSEPEDDCNDTVFESATKRCRYTVVDYGDGNWESLRCLSLWLPAGEVLSPLPSAGLNCCPALEEVRIKVEGDCRTCGRPSEPEFGLRVLAGYPQLAKMRLDLGEAVGYALTAPEGQMDLSVWERFYLLGIDALTGLYELDYWPPQDRDMNQRCMLLPAFALLQRCRMLRKLFIHGTAHEHFLRFFPNMENLRDMQLREDYYPAPEYDSTEMRAESCYRIETLLNSRWIPD